MWAIEKLAFFKNGKWNETDDVNVQMKIEFDLLLIVEENRVKYYLRLGQHVKGYIKGNIVVLAYESEGTVNKLKAKISKRDDLKIIQDKLSSLLHVECITEQSDDVVQVQKVLQKELSRMSSIDTGNEFDFPPGFNLEDFLKRCIMDPNFSLMVDKVEKALMKYLPPK